jgi:hypothetical protein
LNVIDTANQTINACFLRTYILTPGYLLFTIFNAYLLSSTHDIPRKFANTTVSFLRSLTALTLIATLANTFTKYFLNLDPSTPASPNSSGDFYLTAAYLTVDLYQLAAFALNTLIVWNKDLFAVRSPLSFVLVNFTVAATNLVNAINYFYLTWSISFSSLSTYERFFFIYTAALNALLLLNLLAIVLLYYNLGDLLRTRRLLRTYSATAPLVINENDDSENNQDVRFESLRDHHDQIMTTSMIADDSVVAEEDFASYYSYLTFNWLRKLMRKGYQRQISSIDDLCRLPADLYIASIFDRFLGKYFKHAPQNEYVLNPILNSGVLRDERLINKLTSSRYEEDNLVTFEVKNSATAPTRHNLLTALLKSFGREFFLLGLLKFANDCLSFSGPLLLNQLVQFVQVKSEDMREGVLYAIGLFVCTLVGCLLNIHFTNWLNKLCLRIRVALISLIYRKSLIVKL